jgi:hypothetical protein
MTAALPTFALAWGEQPLARPRPARRPRRRERRPGRPRSGAGRVAARVPQWAAVQPVQPQDRCLLHRVPARLHPAGSPAPLFPLVLGLWFIAETGAWLATLAWMAARGAGWLRRSTVQRWLERVTGIALIGFGLRLATQAR